MYYVRRVPPPDKPKSGTVPTWHKMYRMESERTIRGCNMRIKPHWERQEQKPPAGERGCYRCFPGGTT